MAEQHKRAAAEYEKQARDAKALLKSRAESKLKAKEIELSAQREQLPERISQNQKW